MNTQAVTVQQQRRQDINTVQQTLEQMKGQLAMALPAHIKPERMIRVALTAIQNTPKLLECDKNSFYLAVLRSAQLGLEPDGVLGQAYLIPFGKQVQLIPGYKGLIDLARRSGEVSNIIAKEVYEHDEFSVDWSEEVPFRHVPKLDGERGDVKYFWALARFKDGGFHWDYMTKAEVERVRDKSQGKNNAVWKDYFIEMGKKTAIRRIAKYLPMSVQRAAAIEDLVDAGKQFTVDQLGEIVIDGGQGAEPETPSVTKLDKFAGANPETGEIQEQVASQNKEAAKAELPPEQPRLIPAKALPDDATQTDWESWTEEWQRLVVAMHDAQSLNKLRKHNEAILGNLQKLNPPKHNWCMEQFSIRMAQVGSAELAA